MKRASAVLGLMIVAFLRPQYGWSHETLTTTVLFDREIVRVLNRHCVMCHVENGPSFPIATYEETFLRGRTIRSEVLARHMRHRLMPKWRSNSVSSVAMIAWRSSGLMSS